MSDVKDLKGFLYGWLGRKNLGVPAYTINATTHGNVQRFKCELRVPGQAYTAIGNSRNKRDSATNAAMDFCQYLVRKGCMQSSEVPVLTSGALEGSDVSFNNEANEGPGSFFGSNTQANDISTSTIEQKPTEVLLQPKKEQSHFDRYVMQKADEIAQSESVDLKAEIHGGWTMENSKQALNEFLQKTRQPAASYNTQMREANSCRTFVSELVIFVPQVRKSVSSRGQGSSKKVAESLCAMSMVRQLFHMGIMAEFKGQRRKATAANVPEVPLSVPESLFQRLKDYMAVTGVQPVVPNSECTEENPVSLLTDIKLETFPDSEVDPPGTVSWAPCMQNWNPWRGANIDEEPLAFMSLTDISKMISDKEHNKNGLEQMMSTRNALPVAEYRGEIVNTILSNTVTLIKGQTGCGKSTQVAQFLLDYYISLGKGAECNCIVSQPRRISAISLAERVAAERGEEVGETVGYGVRFDSVSPRPYGSVMFCTVGVLLKKMEGGLRGISHVIIDEIHERDINTDFVLIVLREMVREYPTIRIVLMSATIDTNLFQNFFGGCPVIEMHGRTHPVQHYFLEDVVSMLKYMPPAPDRKKGDDDEEEVENQNRNMNIVGAEVDPKVKVAMSRISEREIPLGVIEALLTDISARGDNGAVLIFLPGWNEIMLVLNSLSKHAEFSNQSKFVVLPLHSQLTGAEQRKVFDHYGDGVRKIILSTNLAETSVTIDDVVFVIDSCKAKERLYTSNNNMVHFATVWASRTNLTQRRGRAGRVRPGFAFHLCSKARFDALEEHRTAEMLRTPLHEISLTIKLLRLGSVGEFLGKALEPPPCDAIVESETLLQSMGALDRNLQLTALGRMLARLPIEPIMGKYIILGIALGVGPLMCDIAAASSFSTPFVPRERSHTRLNNSQRSFAGNRYSDHIAVVMVNQAFRDAWENGSQAESNLCQRVSLNNAVLRMTSNAKRQLTDVLVNHCGYPEDQLFDHRSDPSGEDQSLDILTSLLVLALYPNVCYFRGNRKVYTLEQATALLSKSSVITPFQGDKIDLPSPILVFTEKLRTRAISCKDLTVISAAQLLIFGSRKVEVIGANLIRCDDMIPIRCDVALASHLVALRPCIEALLVRTCLNPGTVATLTAQDVELGMLLRELSSPSLCMPAAAEKDYLLTDAALMTGASSAFRGRGRGRGRGAPRGAGEHNNWGFGHGPPTGPPGQAPQDFFNGAAGDWSSNGRGGKWGGRGRGYGGGGMSQGYSPYPQRSRGGFRGGNRRGGRGRGYF